jgi:hypothetical protein
MKNIAIIVLVTVILASFSSTNSKKDKIILGQREEISLLNSKMDFLNNENDSIKRILSGSIIEYINFREKMMLSESGGLPTIVNGHTGAQGLFQFMPAAKKAIGIDPYFPVHKLSEYEQYVLFGEWVNLLEERLGNYMDIYEGSMLFDTIPITKYGLIATAHLGGVNGTKKMLLTQGAYNPTDGYTSLSDYLWKFSGGH